MTKLGKLRKQKREEMQRYRHRNERSRKQDIVKSSNKFKRQLAVKRTQALRLRVIAGEIDKHI